MGWNSWLAPCSRLQDEGGANDAVGVDEHLRGLLWCSADAPDFTLAPIKRADAVQEGGEHQPVDSIRRAQVLLVVLPQRRARRLGRRIAFNRVV
eukprot:CAMPEP_0197492470 /NCGR_PEP_ID=MMETSP1311-20131121/9611_1 /TAXON_ID=464262 /ORGANISM="Genus nov. species nov., Strain RCC856" /LENGTH=93 /DNA_ID=CAMNT_0043037387 /DNA_START=40 /DNA_END=318 /DNA_ORIENTATION=+